MNDDEMPGLTDGEKDHLNPQTKHSLHSKLIRKKIYKNLLVVSVAFLFLFTAFQALTNLQSSINKDDGLGTASLSVIYGSLVVSCMFVPAPAINLLGYKRCIAASMVCYIIYIATNFYAEWVTLIPGSFVVGIAAAPLWSAKCSYLSASGKKYARMSGETPEAVVSGFFGTFFMIFQTSQIWGNIIASTILEVHDLNRTDTEMLDVPTACGAMFCNNPINNTNLNRPSDFKIYTLMGVYLGLSCLAVLIVLIFLNDIDHRSEEDSINHKGTAGFLIETFRHLRHGRQILLIPLTLFTGMEQGFVGSDFTKSYISCLTGIWMVGYVMICYGVANAISCIAFGTIVKYVGRITVFSFGAILQAGILFGLLYWHPVPEHSIVLFVFAGLWGICDAIWQTQVNALYGCIFYERAGAFSNHRMWQSIGFIVAFAYSSYLCTDIKIYIIISLLFAGMAGYYVIEWLDRDMQRPRQQSNVTIT